MNLNWRNKIQVAFLLLIVSIQSCSPDLKDYDQLVTISTSKGDMKLILFNDTPLHKKSFIELASNGAYDSTNFHRVIEGFMVQGGDVSSNEKFEKESRRLIPAEIRTNRIHTKGMVGAARQTNVQNPYKHSTTQFYIVHGAVFEEKELRTDIDKLNGSLSKYLYDGNHEDLINEFKELQDENKTAELQSRVMELRSDMEAALNMSFENTSLTAEQLASYTTIGGAPHLDGEYSVFGKVVDGLEVIDAIAETAVDSLNRPTETIFMNIIVEDILKDSLTAQYGIIYPPTPSDN